MFGDVIVEQAGVTNVIKGQTLETIAGVCDGRTIEGETGTYTLENVTSMQELNYGTNANWDTVNGSTITYKPPVGTKQVIYTFNLHISSSTQNNPIASFKIYIDDNEITNFVYSWGSVNSYSSFKTIQAIFEITDGAEDISNGKINWTTHRTIKLKGADFHSGHHATLFIPEAWIDGQHWGPSATNVGDFVSKPNLKIKAIGEKTTVNSFVPHNGMTIQTQHKDYKKKVAKDNSGWDPIDNDLDTGFVVKIQPTSANSKVLINTIVHIGMKQSDDARWWGAKLYRKIGSEGWNEVLEANGDNTAETLGGSNSVSTGTSVWFSNTSGIEDSNENYKVGNAGASFLDSPNSTDTIYYTIYWASRIGNLPVNIILYLNRAYDHGDLYRPSPISSITASEIWSSGSPYIPPTDGVISVYNNKIGIDNTTPTYDLDVSGNINFTGTLYQDGVAFSGGGGGGSSVTNVIKGQTLETIAGVCDGRVIEAISGTYTLPAVTQPQECADGSPWTELTGSKISYKPPSGTKQVIYKLHVHVSGLEYGNYSNSTTFITSMRLKLDNNIITNYTYHEGGVTSNADSIVVLTGMFEIGSENNISEGKLTSWNSNKEIKIEVTAFNNASRTTMYHGPLYIVDPEKYTNSGKVLYASDSYSTPQDQPPVKPRMEIKAIGEKTTVNSFVPHNGMTIQTQHKDYKKKVMKDNANWDAIDNDLDTGFVVKIKPTSQNSKVMINMNAHIGVLDTPNARWWGAKLYRKIGSGTWLEVTEANGDNSPSTVGGSDAGHNGTPVWFSDNNGTNDGTMANSSASYLDSPNTTETIYYTIYWASSLNGTNSRLYLNRVDHQNSAIRPSPISSITASEIWSGGSPYIPPTDGVISVYNNKIGIDNTTPSYDLDVSGNINFTGTLYQDGVAFSGGGGGSSDILLFFADVINASVHASDSIVNIYTSYKYSISGGGKESAFSNPIIKGSNFIASGESSTTTSWGTYVRKLTLPAGIPSELEVIMKGRVQWTR